MAVRALFRKSGIVYCSSREELITVACIFYSKPLKGKKVAIITHAGGSAVMLTDSLVKSGLEVPVINKDDAADLLNFLYPGSSTSNPIDFLATGTAEQLGIIIDYCEHKFDEIDAMVVVFGSPGLFNVANVYDVLRVKIDVCTKPIYPVLPSVINAHNEIINFIEKGNVNFPDEVLLGTALGAVYNTPAPMIELKPSRDNKSIKKIISTCKNGFISPDNISNLLNEAGIPLAAQQTCNSLKQALEFSDQIGYPIVAKVVGPLHKTEVNGVHLNVRTVAGLELSFEQLMKIQGAEGVLIQKMHQGIELFIGVKYEPGLGHLILFGLGGIFVEVFKDIQSGLAPLRESEIRLMMKQLKAYTIITGFRGKEGINENLFIDLITRVSKLVENAPEIMEIDLNPLLANMNEIIAVDARISVLHKEQKQNSES
jgi:acyl-CoA synthetase (NDP forming)